MMSMHQNILDRLSFKNSRFIFKLYTLAQIYIILRLLIKSHRSINTTLDRLHFGTLRLLWLTVQAKQLKRYSSMSI
jgi:hypothetical protein